MNLIYNNRDCLITKTYKSKSFFYQLSFQSSVVWIMCHFGQVLFQSTVVLIKCCFDQYHFNQVSLQLSVVSIKCHLINCHCIAFNNVLHLMHV